MRRGHRGQVLELERKAGRTFALRFRAYGKRRYLTLGTADEGWTRRRAEEELENVLADVRRGIWRPQATASTVSGEPNPSFHEFASKWLDAMRHEGLAPTTVATYRWELTHHLLPFFAGHRLAEITISEVDRYRQEKVREGLLNATSINKTIARLAQILDIAVERELIDRNPARGRRRKLRQRAPERTWLDRAEQIEALLQAAGELDSEARVDRRATPRRALLATLTLAGLRRSRSAGVTSTSPPGACASAARRPTPASARSIFCQPFARSSRPTRRRRGSDGRTTSSSRRSGAVGPIPPTSASASWPGPSSGRTRSSRARAPRRCPTV
jgi:Phage integrase central domain